jgi:hypothetical protein
MYGDKKDEGKPNLAYFGHNFNPWCISLGSEPLLKGASDEVTTFWSKLNESKPVTELHGHLCIALDQVPREILLGAVYGFKYGAEKYAPLNYAKGIAAERLVAAFRRHVFWYPKILGESVDIDTGLAHEVHATCCILMLMENLLLDRYKPVA